MYRLVSAGTCEERIVARATEKLALEQLAIHDVKRGGKGSGGGGPVISADGAFVDYEGGLCTFSSPPPTVAELREMAAYGATAVFSSSMDGGADGAAAAAAAAAVGGRSWDDDAVDELVASSVAEASALTARKSAAVAAGEEPPSSDGPGGLFAGLKRWKLEGTAAGAAGGSGAADAAEAQARWADSFQRWRSDVEAQKEEENDNLGKGRRVRVAVLQPHAAAATQNHTDDSDHESSDSGSRVHVGDGSVPAKLSAAAMLQLWVSVPSQARNLRARELLERLKVAQAEDLKKRAADEGSGPRQVLVSTAMLLALAKQAAPGRASIVDEVASGRAVPVPRDPEDGPLPDSQIGVAAGKVMLTAVSTALQKKCYWVAQNLMLALPDAALSHAPLRDLILRILLSRRQDDRSGVLPAQVARKVIVVRQPTASPGSVAAPLLVMPVQRLQHAVNAAAQRQSAQQAMLQVRNMQAIRLHQQQQQQLLHHQGGGGTAGAAFGGPERQGVLNRMQEQHPCPEGVSPQLWAQRISLAIAHQAQREVLAAQQTHELNVLRSRHMTATRSLQARHMLEIKALSGALPALAAPLVLNLGGSGAGAGVAAAASTDDPQAAAARSLPESAPPPLPVARPPARRPSFNSAAVAAAAGAMDALFPEALLVDDAGAEAVAAPAVAAAVEAAGSAGATEAADSQAGALGSKGIPL